jgi:UPF0271 protein
MARMVSAAARLGVAAGAHPSYPDPAGFGRAEMPMPEADLRRCIADQVRALRRVADAHGVALRHVKPHGALYHAARRAEVARALAAAVADVDPGLLLVGQAGSPALDVWSAMGLAVVPEAFADRRYEADGSLRPRTRSGAVLQSPADAAGQAVRIATGLGVVAGDGSVLPVAARTVCIHSDSPDAPAIARAVRAALEAAGVPLRGPAGPAPGARA